MKTIALLGVSALALSACAHTTFAPNYAAIVGMIQSDYPVVKAAAGVYAAQNPTAASIVAKVEADADPLVAALSATYSPTSMQAALSDVSALLTALPVGAISAQTKADIALGLSILATAVQTANL